MDFLKFLRPVFISVLFLSGFIYPQNKIVQKTDSAGVYKISDVVITATKTESSTIELANSISVIDSSEIANKKKNTVFDLLRDEYGLSLSKQGGPGALSYVYMRGASSGNTLVLIDGIEMNMPSDPSNTYDFANLSTDNIKRIEVLRGPQSTLYGSDAMAGVINIITKKGYGKPKFFLSTEGGSYNTYKGMGGLNGSIDKLNYSITLSRYKTDGFSSASSKYGNKEKDGYSNYNISSRIGLDLSKYLNINFVQRFTIADADFDQAGGKFGDDPTYKYKSEEQIYRVEANLNLFNGFWNQQIAATFFRNVRKYNYDSTLFNPVSSNSIYDGRKFKFEWQNNLHLSKSNLLTFGIETEKEKAFSYFYSNSFFTGIFTSTFPSKIFQSTGLYLQDQIKVDNRFFTTLGFRYDDHAKFGNSETYRIAPAYMIWETGTKFKATLGTGFKSPSLFYLYDPAFGNADLKPEKSLGWDAGIEQYLWGNNLMAGITYFNNYFKDLFGFDSNYRTININKAETNGIEFYLTSDPINDLGFKTSFTYTNTKDKSPNSADENLPLLRIPKIKISGSINYKFTPDINSNFEIIYVGKRDDKDFSVYPTKRVQLKNYTLVNLSASYQINNLLQLYGRIDNLFDQYYEEVLGYATPGFSGYLGVKFGI